MQTAEAYDGVEQQPHIGFCEEQGRELQDLVSCFLPLFRRKALRYLSNTADAEDAVQDALLSAYKHLDQFRGQAQMSTWLTAIVTNCARMQLRRRPRAVHLSLDEQLGDEQEYSLSELLPDSAPSPEDQCRQSELHVHLMHFVGQLSPPLRTAFQLCALDGLQTNQAAQVLGLAEGTIKAQLARARAKIRKLMRRALDPQRHRRAYKVLASNGQTTKLN
jgi:RNA polymerase sigma-70 factor, ECF subfamily